MGIADHEMSNDIRNKEQADHDRSYQNRGTIRFLFPLPGNLLGTKPLRPLFNRLATPTLQTE